MTEESGAVTEAENIRLLMQLRNSSEWLGDDNISGARHKEHRAKQREAFNKLSDLLCAHEWKELGLDKVRLFECSKCKIRRLGSEF